MDVADVLRDRVSEPDGFQRMAVISVARARRAVRACSSSLPGRWLSSRRAEAPKTVMTITLGGGSGGPSQRRHDVDWRTGGPGGDAAEVPKRPNRVDAAGREDAGDDGADSDEDAGQGVEAGAGREAGA